MHRIVLLLLLAPMLAGCAEESAPLRLLEASVAADWGGQRDPDLPRNVHAVVTYDPASRPSADMYEGRDVRHPSAFTVHDLFVTWEAQGGPEIEYGYFDGMGYIVQSVAGVAATQPDENGASWFWQLQIDGAPAQQGISQAQVHEHGAYVLRYTKFDPN